MQTTLIELCCKYQTQADQRLLYEECNKIRYSCAKFILGDISILDFLFKMNLNKKISICYNSEATSIHKIRLKHRYILCCHCFIFGYTNQDLIIP